MADEVKITFVADDAQLIKSAKAIQAETDKLAAKLKEAGVSQSAYNKAMADAKTKFDQQAKSTQKQKVSLTELSSAVNLVQTGIRVLGQVYDATVASTMKYAQSVRDLSIASGTSAEASSTLLQVLDDFQISAEDVTAATKAMKEKGIVPTVESLATLADQFVAIQDPAKRLEFAQDNLGKSYSKYLNVLSKGGDELRKNAEQVNKNLILTDEQIKQTEQLRLAQDQLSDNWQGLTTNIGTKAIPALNNVLTATNKNIERGFQWSDVLDGIPIVNLIHRVNDLKAAQEENNPVVDSATQSYTAWAEAIGQVIVPMEDAEAAAKALEEQTKLISDENKNFLNTLGTVSDSLHSYQEGIAAADQELADGKITVEEHTAKVAELAATYEDTVSRIVLSLLEMKYTSDGTFDDAELNKYLLAAEKLGVITEADRQATVALYEEVNNLDAAMSDAGASVNDIASNAANSATNFSFSTREAKELGLGTQTLAKRAKDALDPLKHVGERAEDAGEGFGVMGAGASELGDVINSEALPAVAGLKSQINGLPPTGTQWDYQINIEVSGSVPGNLPPGGVYNNGNGTINVGGGVMGECFVAGTLVAMADGSLARIEDIRVDDEIQSWHDGKFITVKVEKTFHHIASETPQLVRLNSVLIGTPEHLIYTDGDWLPLGFLRRGDPLLIDGRRAEVKTIELVPGFVPVYNLETNHESHNYFANGILVHNGKAAGGTLNPGAFTIVGEGAGGWSPTAEVVYNGMVIPHMAAQWMKDAGMLGGARGMASGGALRGENLLPPTRDKDELDQVRIEQNEIQETETAAVAETIASFVSADIQQATAAQSVAFSSFMSASTAATAEQTVILKQILNKLPSARDEATAIRENALKDF